MDGSDVVCSVLRKTYSSNRNSIKEGEKELCMLLNSPTYVYDLLVVIFDKPVEKDLKISASIALKNYIEKNWSECSTNNITLSEEVRTRIKTSIFAFMISAPPVIQRQLLHVITVIAKHDFPVNWRQLLPKMAESLTNNSFENCKPVLKLATMLFDRYRFEEQSKELWIEIKHVLDAFAAPLTRLFEKLMIELNKSDPVTFGTIFTSLKYIVRIFLCLTSQEFPEYFEDHAKEWFSWFIAILQLNLNNYRQQYPDVIIEMEKVKARIIQVVGMFKRKYSEDLQSYDAIFIETIWKLAVEDIQENSIEQLGSECIKFMLTAFSMTPLENLLIQRESFTGLCSHIIMPSIIVRKNDEDRFEDEPDEYVREEIEGGVDSRRHSAIDFVAVLSNLYEEALVPLFLDFVQHLIMKHSENPNLSWKYKDAAVRLMIAISKNFGSLQFGTVVVSRYIDVNKIFNEMIASDLFTSTTPSILLSTYIKYMIIYRNILSDEIIHNAIPYLISLLKHPSSSVQILICIFLQNAFLPLNNTSYMSRLSVIVENLQNIYSYLLILVKPECKFTCETAIKCIVSILSHTQLHSKMYLASIFDVLLMVFSNLHTYSLRPSYLHCFYNSFCLCIRLIHLFLPQSIPEFSGQLVNQMPALIELDIHSSFEYQIQLLSVIIYRYCPFEVPTINSFYLQLLQYEFWDGEPDRVYSLTLLLSAYCHSMPNVIISRKDHLYFANLFHRLCNNTKYDAVVFNILIALTRYLPWSETIQFPLVVFKIIFARLTKLKRPKYISGFCEFIYVFINSISPGAFFDTVESVQPNIIDRIIDNVLIVELHSLLQFQRKRNVSIALAQLLFFVPQISLKDPNKWANQLVTLLKSNPPMECVVSSDVIKLQSSLGNNDVDLIFLGGEFVLDPILNGLQFSRRTVDFHHNLPNIPLYIKELWQKVQSTLPSDALNIVQTQFPLIGLIN